MPPPPRSPSRSRAPSRSRSRSRSPSPSRARPGAFHLSDSIASLSARTAVAQAGAEAIDSATPLAVDLLYRWDGPGTPPSNGSQDPRSAPPSGAQGHLKEPFDHPVPGSRRAQHAGPRVHGSAARRDGSPPVVVEEEDCLAWCRHLPWWKRPSDTMLRPFVFLLAVGLGVVIPVKVEFFDQLACESLYSVPAPAMPGLPSSPSIFSLPTPFRLFHAPPSDATAPHLPYGPDNPALCHSPPVLALSASLQMRITVICGLLSVLTTGWWTGRSDRLGRRGVMIWGALGMLINAAVFVITALVPRSRLPGGSNFLLVGAVAEGLVGGMPTMMATFSAYISDASPPGTKAVGYSMFLALIYIALALGPILGGHLVSMGGLVPVFDVAAIIAAFYFAFALLLLPESCSPSALASAQKDHLTRMRLNHAQLEARLASAPSWFYKVCAIAQFYGTRIFQPLAVLAPAKVQDTALPETDTEAHHDAYHEAHHDTDDLGERSPLLNPSRRASAYSTLSGLTAEANSSYISVSRVAKRWTRDYNLLLISLAMWLETSVVGVLPNKMLYAQQHFQWGAPEMGEYMTAAALSRVLALSLILPLAIKLLHRPARRIALPQDNGAQHDVLDHEGRVSRRASRVNPSDMPYEDGSPDCGARPLASPSASSSSSRSLSDSNTADRNVTETERHIEHAWTVRATHLRLLHDSRFDLLIARISMVVAAVCYLGTATATTGTTFIFWTCAACLGAGAGAAISSLSVALLKDPKDAGRLFGANSVLAAIGQTVASPIVFTRVYQSTADTPYSWAIFALAASFFGTASVLLCFVRVRKPKSLPALPPRPASRVFSPAP